MPPAGVVESIAAVIEAEYFDADRARAIASMLRTKGRQSAFDKLTDP